MNVTIHVTEQDIRHGKRRSCGACPVARALNRTLKLRGGGVVYNNEVNLWRCSRTSSRKSVKTLPESVRSWIAVFDAQPWRKRSTFPPISFKLNIPKWVADEN